MVNFAKLVAVIAAFTLLGVAVGMNYAQLQGLDEAAISVVGGGVGTFCALIITGELDPKRLSGTPTDDTRGREDYRA